MVLLLEAAGGRVPDGVLPHIEKSMNLLLQKSGSDIGAVVSSDEFLALLDLFHGDRKTAFCKSFLKVRWMKTGYCSVPTPLACGCYGLCAGPSHGAFADVCGGWQGNWRRRRHPFVRFSDCPWVLTHSTSHRRLARGNCVVVCV